MLIEFTNLPPAIQQQILQIKADDIIQIVDNGKIIKQFAQPIYGDHFSFDIQRIQQSIESGRITVPHFHSFDEFDQWLHRDDC